MSVLSQKNFLPWEKHLDSIANNGKRLQHPVTFYFYAIGFWQLSHKFHWYTTGLLRGYLCHLKTRVRAPVLPHTYADASREFSGQGKKNRILTHLGFEFSSSEVSRFSFLMLHRACRYVVFFTLVSEVKWDDFRPNVFRLQ